MRWLEASRNPAPRIPVAVRVALTTSWTVSPWATKRSGNSCTCSWRTSPPNKLHLATPGTASKRGRRSHSANDLSSMGVRLVDNNPTFRRSMVAEVNGDIRGALMPNGSVPAISASRSEINCRARIRSVPSANTTVTMESPWIDSERRDSCAGSPASADSTGRVTMASTCSGARPGASVWMVAWGGTKSGKTSSLECDAT